MTGSFKISLIIDLIKGHPILNFIVITFEADIGKMNEELDQLTVTPTTVFLNKV